MARPTRPDWLAIWTAMTDSFGSATETPISLSEIALQMSSQALDANPEVLRLILIAGLLTRSDLVLYEDENLIDSLDDGAASRLSENITAFSVKNPQILYGQRKALLDILARRLQLTITPDSSALMEVVATLYRRLLAMPAYTLQTTKSLSRDSLAVRQCFRGASEPDTLLFATLPTVLMIEPFTGSERLNSVAAGEYTVGIFKAINELQSAYPNLLNDIRQQLAKAVSLGVVPLSELRADLVKQARTIATQNLDADLAAFVGAIMSCGGDEKWLEKVAGVTCGGHAPMTWTDDTTERFRTGIAQVGASFREALHSR
ncbi:hypothetical protein MU0083_000554 [[Mycobacterium] kokjensenii]|uniref:Uncharacterized protein n=1 Tax=[Mycobacterium] kokjensenii TaxID=3064287 RepID=A0ABN9MST5_9MYCO|nr:hypothetical protein [Mycolicibacter sp. MU0083]CAJ1493908.1 hypothetical protein MU0083_000554 [Mycolicibacter sp. MU0083]